MGKYVFKLPDVGEGTAEAEIAAWHVKVGDKVDEDQAMVDVMTDKATVEIPTPIAGTVISITGNPGEMMAVGSPIIVFEVEGEGNSSGDVAVAAPAPKKAEAPVAAPAPVAKTEPKPAAEPVPAPKAAASGKAAFATRTAGEKPQASPAVRNKAHELGIELQYVPGTGPGGRITSDDLEAFIASGGQTAVGRGGPVEKHGVEQVKVIGLRRKIAERMQDTKRRIPHYSYIEEIDVTALEDLRAHLNATKQKDQPKLTVLPFLMKAIVKAVVDFPMVNARFDDEQGVVDRHEAVHIGIAAQTPGGLMVPVVMHAEAKDIWESATEVARLANAARDGKASREELSGSTITITSLGAIGGLATTPVINSPEVAIIGVNKINERPVVKNGQIVIRKIMNLSSSFDHRVVDGFDGAEFVQRLKGLLEQPATLFMD